MPEFCKKATDGQNIGKIKEKKSSSRVAQRVNHYLWSLLWFCVQSSTEKTVSITNPHLIYQHGHDPHLCSQSLWLIYHGVLIASAGERILAGQHCGRYTIRKIHGLWTEISLPWHLPGTYGFEQFSGEYILNLNSHVIYVLRNLVIFSTLLKPSSQKKFWSLTHEDLKMLCVLHDTSNNIPAFPFHIIKTGNY